MRKGILALAISIMFSQVAHAQLRVPSGCFVTDDERSLYSTPPACFNEERAAYLPYNMSNGYTAEQIISFYGYQYGFEVNMSTDFFYKWQDAEGRVTANRNNSDTHYAWYVAEFNKNKQMKSLESKLRKACGTKCKKIKTVKSLADQDETRNQRRAMPSHDGLAASLTFDHYMERSSGSGFRKSAGGLDK
jgi:hypothetical protein